MDRRNFLGSAISASLAIGGLLRFPPSIAGSQFQNQVWHQTISFTDGDIAVDNHLNSLARLYQIFEDHPNNLSISSSIINSELINSQFLGDYSSLDRLSDLSEKLLKTNLNYPKAYIQVAQIYASMHQFNICMDYLRKAELLNGDQNEIDHIQMSVLQATTNDRSKVLDLRKEKVINSGAPEDLIHYAALLADDGQIEEANSIYLKALHYKYKNPSPFIPAWICFQIGLLWGEIAKHSNKDLAFYWYKKAIAYIPKYTKARVHLAEIYTASGRNELALQTLQPALASTDPEVSWKISDIYAMDNQPNYSAQYLQLTNTLFTSLLERYPLAFADHAAEFYISSGNNPDKAYQLALLNYQNRPTERAANLLQNTRKLH